MTPAPIVLPRPNLGPEPWPEAPLWPWLIGAAIALGLSGLVVRRLLRRARASEAESARSTQAPATPIPAVAEPVDRVRSALVRAFGPAWRARTTEEVAASPDVAGRFGEEVAARVVDYLRAVDRSRFSADPAGPSDELAWWAARFAEEVESAPAADEAQATSKMSGK